MRNYRQPQRSNPMRVARTILAATLLLGVLASAVPLATIASGPMCELACCAGRAPHAAGSCMNGSCHAFATQRTKKVHGHQDQPRAPAELLCGLSRLKIDVSRIPSIETVTVDAGSGVDSDHSHGASTSSSDQASASTTAFQKPCQPDCGSCASGFVRPNRQRNAAVLAHADRPRPPSRGGLGSTDYDASKTRNALGYRGVPRGPPSPSS